MNKKTFTDWVFNNFVEHNRHVIKRIFQKLLISYRRKAEHDDSIPRSKYEKVGILICKNIVSNEKTKLTLNVNEFGFVNERYAENEDLDITIYIYENSIEVIKNDITREIVTSPKTHQKIVNIFDGHVRQRRDIKKEQINSKLKDTLEAMVIETKNDLNNKNKQLVKK